MFYKLSINNVKKSFKDYSIYFLTLTVAVCIFYVFNSIDAQKYVLTGNAVSESFLANMEFAMNLLSVFVTIVLAGLILYANNFLVRKRKKEFGIYMTLGMAKVKISFILLLETLFVGIAALVTGLILGFILSQGMAVFSAYLLNIEMAGFKLVFSANAFFKTIFCFGLVFVIVMFCNLIVISKCKLSDLLCASRKNQSIKISNPKLLALLFILSLLILAAAYALVLSVGMNPLEPMFLVSIAVGAAGTFLFVYSLSGSLLFFMRSKKNIYYKKLNIFVLRQLNNKIMTNFVSMAMISFLLFLSISISLSMFTYRSNLEKSLEGNLNFDASGSVSIYNSKDRDKDLRELINKNKSGIRLNEKTEFAVYVPRSVDTSLTEILGDSLSDSQKANIKKSIYGSSNIAGNAVAIRISDYNNIRQLLGHPAITLADNEVLIVSNFDDKNVLTNYINSKGAIEIDEKNYTIKNDKPIVENISTGSTVSYFYIIVPDTFISFIEGPEETYINFICTGTETEKADQKEDLEKLLNYYSYLGQNSKAATEPIAIYGTTNDQFRINTYGSAASLIFIGIYLGLIFLIASVAVLAIQQLSEASDSLERYRALQKIGVPDKTIEQSIFKQILVYFAIPLGLAITDSVVGLRVLGERFNQFHLSIFSGFSLIAILVFIFVFFGYLYITFKGYKNVISRNS